MSFPEIIGLLGILIAFFVVIFFTYKGFHLAYVVMVACIIVLVTNNMPLMESFSQTIMPKVGEQAATLLPLYLFGAIFGKMFIDSGAAHSLSKFLLNLLGKNATAQRKRMIGFACVIIMNVIFNYVGVDPFASLFTMIGIATGVMAEADIPRKYMPVMLVLGSTLGNVMPGSLAAPNIMAANILDPEYTYSVSKKQTAAGTADIISHICENYFNNTPSAYVQAGFAETLLRSCFRYGKIAYQDPTNYEARANLMWTSSLAINGILNLGCPVAWCVHPMEHELSAFYDITHGEGLAILTPNWMEYVLSDKTVDRFVQYGVNVWGIDSSLEKFDIAHKAIEKTRAFFQELNIPSTLREVGIGEEKLEIMAKKAASMGLEHAYVPLDEKDVLAIYRASL